MGAEAPLSFDVEAHLGSEHIDSASASTQRAHRLSERIDSQRSLSVTGTRHITADGSLCMQRGRQTAHDSTRKGARCRWAAGGAPFGIVTGVASTGPSSLACSRAVIPERTGRSAPGIEALSKPKFTCCLSTATVCKTGRPHASAEIPVGYKVETRCLLVRCFFRESAPVSNFFRNNL